VLLDREGGQAIDPTARIVESRLGAHVTVGPGAVIEHCALSDCVIGANSILRHCGLEASLVGEHCHLDGVQGTINVGDYGELTVKEQG
jgi:carbonic anhydrase/acetyltransferase-like protein (isoleucine patch superfamily)